MLKILLYAVMKISYCYRVERFGIPNLNIFKMQYVEDHIAILYRKSVYHTFTVYFNYRHPLRRISWCTGNVFFRFHKWYKNVFLDSTINAIIQNNDKLEGGFSKSKTTARHQLFPTFESKHCIFNLSMINFLSVKQKQHTQTNSNQEKFKNFLFNN